VASPSEIHENEATITCKHPLTGEKPPLWQQRHRGQGAHGHPIPFVRKGSRDEQREATGDTMLPALKLPDRTTVTHSRAILAWISRQT